MKIQILLIIQFFFITSVYSEGGTSIEKASIICLFESDSISIGLKGGMLGKKISTVASNKENVSDSLENLLSVIRDKTKDCVDRDTIFLSFDSLQNKGMMKIIEMAIRKSGYKEIIHVNGIEVFYKAKWRFPDSCYINESEIFNNSSIVELVYDKRDTLHDEGKDYDVLIYERILMDNSKFNYWKWIFYVDGKYLGADGSMPNERITGNVIMNGDTAILNGYKDRYGINLKTGVMNTKTFVKYRTDHDLQEYWQDVNTGNFFIRKNNKRK